MSDGVSIRVQGVPELQARFDKVRDQFKTTEVKSALARAAKPLRIEMRKLAPKGPTGNLKKSVKTKRLRGKPAAVSVRGDFSKAPHFHLVVRGTVERFHASGKSVGIMPANEFPAESERSTAGQVKGLMKQEFLTMLKRVGG